MTFKAELTAAVGWDWSDGAVDNDRLAYARQLALGNGDDQAEAAWHAFNQTLLKDAALTLDLTALTRTVLGDTHTVALLSVKALLVVNLGTGAGRLALGGAAENPWWAPFGAAGDKLSVAPDSPLLLVNRKGGWTVDSSHKNLKLAALDDDVTYSVAVLGTTTAASSG